MANPIAALLAGLAAFSSGSSLSAPEQPLPNPAPANAHIRAERPATAQRIADPQRMSDILVGKLSAPFDMAFITVEPALAADGTRRAYGYDGCNTFNAQMTITQRGETVLSNINKSRAACATAVDEEFWSVLGKPSVMFVDASNIVYLTTGFDTIPFTKAP